MREAIISDVHGNLEALVEVLKDIEKQKVDRIVCLGDTIGYGANPEKCIGLVEEYCSVVLDGNHEKIIADFLNDPEEAKKKHDYVSRNPDAEKFFNWTAGRLGYFKRDSIFTRGKNRRNVIRFLNRSLHNHKEENVLYVHASPRDCLFEYLSKGDVENYLSRYDKGDTLALDRKKSDKSRKKLKENFDLVEHICFNGHNHIPAILIELKNLSKKRLIRGNSGIININRKYNFVLPSDLKDDIYELKDNEKVIVNVGAVGQPRNCDPSASYFVFDHARETVECRRVPYDYKTAAAKIRKAGLPNLYSERLFIGE